MGAVSSLSRRRRARPVRTGRGRSGSPAMDFRLVNSRPELPTIAILAGRRMDRKFSSARIDSNREATITDFSCYPPQVERACHWESSEANSRNRLGRRMVAGSPSCARIPNLKPSPHGKRSGMTRSSSRRIRNSRACGSWKSIPARARCLTTGEREVRGFAWAPDSSVSGDDYDRSAEYDATLGPGDLGTFRRGQPAAARRAVSHDTVITGRRRDQRRTGRRGSCRRPPRSTRGLDLDGSPLGRGAGERTARSGRKCRGVDTPSGDHGATGGANCGTDARAALRGRSPERQLGSTHAS